MTDFETPVLDGDFFGTYNKDDLDMPWSSPRYCATDLDMDDEKGAPMDGPDGSCMSIFNSQDMVDEDAFSDNNPDDNKKVTYEEGGANVNENHVIIETFPPQYGDPGIATVWGEGVDHYTVCGLT